jgi:hypothetical protein
MEPRKQAIVDALSRWIRQRPGLEFANYGDVTTYRAEQRSIARDKREAETLLDAVRWRDGITADDLIKAAEGAYSGRLTIKDDSYTSDGATRKQIVAASIAYCTGQYWPTEYRRGTTSVTTCPRRKATAWNPGLIQGQPGVRFTLSAIRAKRRRPSARSEEAAATEA